jgi:hypothetical protein
MMSLRKALALTKNCTFDDPRFAYFTIMLFNFGDLIQEVKEKRMLRFGILY